MSKRQITIMRIVVHVAALLPLIVIIWDFTRGTLTANPIREIQLRTGAIAINLLMLTLACRPVYIITGFKQVFLLRRTFGLYTFMYSLLHFVNFIALDYGFNLKLILEDIFEKKYAIVGFVAFILLLTLAITSINRLRKRLGSNWQKIHRLVYPAAILVVIHYIWLARADLFIPIVYGVALLILLFMRLTVFNNFAQQHFKWLNRTTP